MAFLPRSGERSDLGDHYSLQFLCHLSQSWFRAPQHGRLTAVPQVQGRRSCQAVLAREKGRALASWARVSCIHQRQEEWEADISPSCSGPVEIPMFSLCRGKLASQVSGMNKHCTLPFCSSCCPQEQTQCLGAAAWCCWSLSHGSELSCGTSAFHLPSLIDTGVPVQKGAGGWMLSSAVQWQAGLLHSAAVAAASLSQWEVICGDGLGAWHNSEGEQKRNTGQCRRGGSESPALLNRAAKQHFPLVRNLRHCKAKLTDSKFYSHFLGRTWFQDSITPTIVISRLKRSASASIMSYTGY